MTVSAYKTTIPEKAIDVVEPGRRARRKRAAFDLGRALEFSTEALRSYAYAAWEPVIYDAMIVAASIEFADRSIKRPSRGWARRIALQVPVHDPARWRGPAVLGALHDALGFLTGDFWEIDFVKSAKSVPPPAQECLPFPRPTKAVIAYSDGMDSSAVAGILTQDLGDKLVRVRIGPKAAAVPTDAKEPFTRVPYKFKERTKSGETSARSRGFKFSLISGLAAYLAGADQIVIPESGQGAIGPALVTVAHAYPDYRNHPLFTKRMERFLAALLRKPIRFVFPRLWYTKGQTLREFASLQGGGDAWRATKSCWRNSRWSALNGKLLQCGACAACMLRRMSIHAAGFTDEANKYICADLNASSLADAIQPGFTRFSPAFEQYAIAGTLHLDHMADMAREESRAVVRRHAALTAIPLGITAQEAEANLTRMFERHADEWNDFLNDLGARSFVRKWTRAN